MDKKYIRVSSISTKMYLKLNLCSNFMGDRSSLYTIDSMLLSMYSELNDMENAYKFKETVETHRVLGEIYSLYETNPPTFYCMTPEPVNPPPKKNWWPTKAKTKTKGMFKVKAIADYISNNYTGSGGDVTMLSFKKNQEYYVLNVDKSKNYYIVASERTLPFSSTSASGMVPIHYFDRI